MSRGRVRLGIAGLGYWGPNLVRNFAALETCQVVAIADADLARLSSVSRLMHEVREYTSADDLIDDDEVDAIVLALPAALMPDLAIRAVERGKHVLVEKPMAPSIEAGRRMQDALLGTGLVGMVDFTFVYSPAVRYMSSLLRDGRLGEPRYYQSTRINLGKFQPDVDVVWDLAVHDIAILIWLLDEDPVSVSAHGQASIYGRTDTASLALTYASGFRAFVQVSWMAPAKIRTSLLSCRRGMIAYNDVEPDEKIRVYDVERLFEPGKEDAVVPTFRLGDVLIPRLQSEEPLRSAAKEFIGAILDGREPATPWSFGTRVLSVLETARASLDEGVPVPVDLSIRIR